MLLDKQRENDYICLLHNVQSEHHLRVYLLSSVKISRLKHTESTPNIYLCNILPSTFHIKNVTVADI